MSELEKLQKEKRKLVMEREDLYHAPTRTAVWVKCAILDKRIAEIDRKIRAIV